ncbi:MAG: stage III sporulation protein AE [Clostridiaceae bacterium]|nr:stage III sporulation protein AE [Clostridiaceae bacterium]
MAVCHKKLTRKKTNLPVFISILIILVTWTGFGIKARTYAREESTGEYGFSQDLQEEILEDQVNSDEIRQLTKYIEEYSASRMADIFGRYGPGEMIRDALKGELKLNIAEIIKKCMDYFLQEIYLNLHVLLSLVVLVVLCALLKNLQASFLSESVGEIAFFACYMVGVSLMVIGFKEVSALGLDVIENMVGFMYATVPVMIALLVSGGNIVSGGMFKPVLIMTVELAATLVKNVFVPLVFLSTILSITNNVSSKVSLSRLAGLIKKTATITIGIILTVFIGFITVQGSINAIADGVASKTVKYAIGTFIPVVGSYLSDAADMVIGCSLLVKNAAGVIVLLVLIAICLVPVVKITAVAMLYKITCALVEPISDKRITDCINDVSNSIILIIAAVAVVAFMFIVSVTAVITAGNVSAMVR